MGDPKKTKKKFIRPRKPWDRIRLDEERTLKETYGLKNKKELWMAEKMLKNKRQNARKLLALELEKRIKREKELLDSLKTTGILKGNAILDDVLNMFAANPVNSSIILGAGFLICHLIHAVRYAFIGGFTKGFAKIKKFFKLLFFGGSFT